MARLVSLWRNLAHKNRVDRELDEELREALDLLVEEKLRSGLAPDAARRAARLELGSVESLKGQVQEARGRRRGRGAPGRSRREIGIRSALGAQSRDVVRMVVREGMTPALVGIAAGALAALLASLSLERLVFGVSRIR